MRIDPAPRFHWTIEDFGYTLRDGRGHARAIITRGVTEKGFFGTIFCRNLPLSGPYKSRAEAADWVRKMCLEWEHLPPDSVFGPLPEERPTKARKRVPV